MKPHIKPCNCKTCLNARFTQEQLNELDILWHLMYKYFRSQGVRHREAIKEVEMSKKLFK